jgi:hypothetical protein
MLFSKRPRDLTPEDIQRVLSEKVPEGSEVEFKGALSTKKGSVEPWAAGQDRIEDRARNKLLEEVVAFANTYGGWLLVGVDQTAEKPARADAVMPIRACAELAERLRIMCRDCIDPRLPVLDVEGVEMRDDGAGVVVFHVPRSRMAPHRLTPTKGCYRRHADRTEEMDMREIQDLTLQVERGMAAVDRRFKERHEQFATDVRWFRSEGNNAHTFGLRATLLPLTPIYVDRVHGQESVRPILHGFSASVGNIRHRLFVLGGDAAWRPIIRGTVSLDKKEQDLVSREVHCDGLIEYRMMRRQTDLTPLRLAAPWVMGLFCNAICSAENFVELPVLLMWSSALNSRSQI